MTITKDNTIAQGKEYLKSVWEDKGAKCPCCNQFVKLYKRKLTSSMAYALALINKYHKQSHYGEFFHVENYLKSLPNIASSIRGDFPKLRYWNLIEQKTEIAFYRGRQEIKPVPGYYRITPQGIQFINGMAKVQRIAKLYNNDFYGFAGPEITIQDAIKDKFDYKELMS